MTLLEKIERALALAKELSFTDQQTRELMSLVLDLPITKIIAHPLTFPNIQPLPWISPPYTPPQTFPWDPNTTGPYIGDGTRITCYGVAESEGATLVPTGWPTASGACGPFTVR